MATKIKDIFGSTLRLERTKLIEDHHADGNSSYNDWQATFTNIRKAYKANTGSILIEETTNGKGNGFKLRTDFYPHGQARNNPGFEWRLMATQRKNKSYPRIGCKMFTVTVFNQILKAAGVKPATKVTTRTKALAAKAGR